MASTQRIVEEIQQVFPNVGETQILQDIDSKQKLFVEETLILEDYRELSDISTNIAWTLPSDFLSLEDILLFDVNGYPLEMYDFDLSYDIQKGYIYFKSTNETPIDSIPSGIDKIFLVINQKPTTITGIGTQLDIDETFHEGVKASILEKYFGLFPIDTQVGNQIVKLYNTSMIKYWQSVAKDYQIKAKRYKNMQDSTSFKPYHYNQAGVWTYPRRINTLSAASISTIMESMYSKYVKFTSSAGVVTLGTNFGWTTVPTAVFVGNVLTISSASGELTNTMMAFSNNEDKDIDTWTSTSTQWTYVDASGVITFGIYELI